MLARLDIGDRSMAASEEQPARKPPPTLVTFDSGDKSMAASEVKPWRK